MVVKAETKEDAVKIAESDALEHNNEWGFPNQSWTAIEIDDESQYYDPKKGIVISVVK